MYTAHLHIVIDDDGRVVGASIFSHDTVTRLGRSRINALMPELVGRGKTYAAAVADLRAQVGYLAGSFGREGSALRKMFGTIGAGATDARLGGEDVSRPPLPDMIVCVMQDAKRGS